MFAWYTFVMVVAFVMVTAFVMVMAFVVCDIPSRSVKDNQYIPESLFSSICMTSPDIVCA